jgi:valyl-tRNA synthetase
MLDQTLKLAHPFAPFITETIWQNLGWTGDTVLAVQPWPETTKVDQKAATAFSEIQNIVTESRAIIRELGVTDAHLYYTDVPFLRDNADLVKRLAGLSQVQEVSDGTGVHLTTTAANCWIDIDHDVAMAHLERIKGQQADQAKLIDQYTARLSNESYVRQAPKHLVDETRDQLEAAQAMVERLETEYQRYATLSEQ